MPRLSLGRLAAVFASLLCSARSDTEWKQTNWRDEPAWISQHGEVEAVVSLTRSRLIYFGAVEGKQNLLSAPTPLTPFVAEKEAPNWGGHRFWLGPQSRWNWPPIVDWEFAAADSARAAGGVLTLIERHQDGRYPALERDYAWEGERLSCTARWQGGSRPSYAMVVVAIDVPAEIETKLYRWIHVPQGFVAIRGDKPNTTDPAPVDTVAIEGNTAHIKSGKTETKLGFYPQTLKVNRGAWDLMMSPGPTHGILIESPDYGYLSQIWVGAANRTFCELEQISPYLLPAPDGWCGSTMYLEARRVPVQSGRHDDLP